MPSVVRSRLPFFLARGDKVSKFTISISVFASIAVVGIILYVSYNTNYTVCQNNGKCRSLSSYHKEKLIEKNCLKTCTSNECIHAASNIMEKIDASVDPCEDFFHFACGNWIKKHGRKDNASVMEEQDEVLKLSIKEVLDAMQPTQGTAMYKLKTVYETCMSKKASELNAIPSALKFLEKVGIPNWPHLPEDFRFPNSIEETIGVMASNVGFLGFAFLRITPELGMDGPHWDIGKRNDTSQPLNLTIDSQFALIVDHNLISMQEVFTQTLAYFGIGAQEANKTVSDFMKLRADLNKFHEFNYEVTAGEMIENSTYREMNIGFLNCFDEVSPSLRSVCLVVEHFLKAANITDMYATDSIKVCDKSYFNDLFDILGNYSQREIANYIALKFFADNIQSLNFYFWRLMLKYPDAFSESHSYPHRNIRWKYCVEWLTKNMAPALSLAYVPKKLTKDSRDEIVIIFKSIKKEAMEIYGTDAWIGQQLLSFWNMSMAKMRYFTEEEYLQFIMNEDRVNRFYENFHPTNESFLHNVLEYKKQNYRYLLASLVRYDKIIYEYDPFIVNAYHMENRLDLLFGVLMPPIFYNGGPRSVNLGSIGMFIGHEFGHEMDTFFSGFERISEEFAESYKTRKQCLIDQFNGYEIKQINKYVNGTFTLSENFADYFEMVLGENARRHYLDELETPEKNLPVPYTADQSFYIAFAQNWCSVQSDEKAEESRTRDFHSPPEFRVKGTVSNSLKFSEAFNCPVGSPMNPQNKCNFLD